MAEENIKLFGIDVNVELLGYTLSTDFHEEESLNPADFDRSFLKENLISNDNFAVDTKQLRIASLGSYIKFESPSFDEITIRPLSIKTDSKEIDRVKLITSSVIKNSKINRIDSISLQIDYHLDGPKLHDLFFERFKLNQDLRPEGISMDLGDSTVSVWSCNRDTMHIRFKGKRSEIESSAWSEFLDKFSSATIKNYKSFFNYLVTKAS